MGRRTDIPWLAIRTYYISGNSIADCARKFQVSERQIYNKCNSENWRAALIENFRNARKTLDDQLVLDRTDRLRKHHAILDLAYDAACEALKECTNPSLSGRNKAEATRAAIDAMQKWLLSSRAVEGVQQDAPSLPDDKDDDEGVRYVRSIDPRKSGGEAPIESVAGET